MNRLFFFILIFSCLNSSAQETAYAFTIDGKIIDHQLNPYNNIFVDLSSTLNILTDFVPGKIYFENGSVNSLDLKLSAGNALFKKINKDEEFVKLEGIRSFKIAADSFLVISQLELFPEKKKEKFIVLGYLDETEKYHLYKYQNGSSENYFLKVKADNQWIDCNIMGKEFFQRDIIVKHFYSPPIIAKPNGFSRADMPQVFKMQKFYEYFQGKQKVFFDVGMNESLWAEDANQYATIDDISHDGNWEFTFYSIAGNKTMHGNFSSIFPFDREGDFEWYYPDGNLRAQGLYIKDKLKGSITTYYADGQKQGVYKTIGKNDLSLFEELYDEQGHAIKNSDNQFLQVTDELRNGKILLSFNDKILSSAVSNTPNGSTYLLASTSAKFKDKEDLVYPEEALKQGIGGVVVLRIKLNESGNIEEKNIVFASNEILQDSALGYLTNEDNYKFSPGKVKGQKVDTEFLFFVRFNIVSNYINQYNHHWMNDFMRQHQQQMQHEMLIQSINPPKF